MDAGRDEERLEGCQTGPGAWAPVAGSRRQGQRGGGESAGDIWKYEQRGGLFRGEMLKGGEGIGGGPNAEKSILRRVWEKPL